MTAKGKVNARKLLSFRKDLVHRLYTDNDPAVAGGGAGRREPQPQHLYIDLSGWSPRYFPKILVQYCNTLRKRKMLFGSDWPMIKPERWLSDFEKIEIKDDVRPLILKVNAARLLKLEHHPTNRDHPSDKDARLHGEARAQADPL